MVVRCASQSRARQCRVPTDIAENLAILAGVVNFLPHPNPPRTRGSGVRDSQMMRGLLYIAVLKKVRYALCPMPYALCPVVPHLSLERLYMKVDLKSIS